MNKSKKGFRREDDPKKKNSPTKNVRTNSTKRSTKSTSEEDKKTATKKPGSARNEYKAKRSFTKNKAVVEKRKNSSEESPARKSYTGTKSEISTSRNRSSKPDLHAKKSRTESLRDTFKFKNEDAKDKTVDRKKTRSKPDDERTFNRKPERFKDNDKSDMPYVRRPLKRVPDYKATPKAKPAKTHADSGLIRLNRYIANAGICSRRKADELILAGEVTVNGIPITELGYKVKAEDKVKYSGRLLKREEMVYVLLNKPKDFITTTDDPQERRTVMELVKKASRERIYPVGRLDRNTTGLLLLTNDGDLAQKLAHPKNKVKKIYEVTLDKTLRQEDFDKIVKGLELEDGIATVDDLAYVEGKSKRTVGIEIHIGRTRIVRRIFESLGYEVEKLDRVIYAGLTKKDLSRGKWRHLKSDELITLKHFTRF